MLQTEMKKRGWWAAWLAFALVVACLGFAPVRAVAAPVNLAQGKTATADSREADSVRAELAVDGNNSSNDSRWGSARDNADPHIPHWIYVDLGKSEQIKTVKVYWENRKATEYKVQYAVGESAPAVDSVDWKDIKVSNSNPATLNETFVLDEPVAARFVRLYIGDFQAQDPDDPSKSWPTVSIYEIEVYGEDSEPAEQDMTANVALNCKGGESDHEANTNFTWDKLFDGDTSTKPSRWASADDAPANGEHGPHWVYVDLGAERTVGTVRLYWEQRKADGYKIQLASGDSVPAPDSDEWRTVYENSGRPEKLVDTIKLNETGRARFVRLYIDKHTHTDPDGGVAWGTVGLYEMEVYGGAPSTSVTTPAGKISIADLTADMGTLPVTFPEESDTYEVAYNGTDYEQVVGDQRENGNIPIFHPLVDTDVKVSFKVTNKQTKAYTFHEIALTIPGKQQVEEGDNAAPTVVPELREWKGSTGTYSVADGARVLYANEDLADTAQALTDDYKDIFGKTLTVAAGNADSAKAGDIVLALTGDESLGLDEEGYLMEVTDRVVVTAEEQTGAFWGTRTILQALTTGNGSIPQGTARDYPLYKVRGFMLDVGRKTFSLDFLKQMAKEMAWYKLNDFHVHLNDNYIWVEEYTDETVDEAYSGFRLESNIKEGGNGGKNKADLTSTDMFYTKAEFRSFIEDCRAMGVNVVPEFDMPAHSLAFTKVRPDLRTPRNLTHRGNDHLNLIGDKYDETLAFATSVWDEYTTGSDPVFDGQTTVHIGADEFEADGDAYRTFVNDLFAHMENQGRQVRVWGSLTQIKGKDVKVSGVNEKTGQRRQMNLWSAGWANMKEMYDLGFELINSNDGQYYMVPNADYYHPTGLDLNTVYNNPINTIGNTTIPAGDEQMVGGMFAVWNDMSGKRENGMSEYDIYCLIHESAGLYASSTWGKGARNLSGAKEAVAQVGAAPQTNFGYEQAANEDGTVLQWNMSDLTDASGMGHDLADGENASIVETAGKTALELKGGTSYVQMAGDNPLETVGLNNSLRLKVKRTSASGDPQVLFESPYGSIMAVQEGTGQVGFTRENRAYSFDYALPVGQWVELEFKNEKNFASLYVNGELVERIGDGGKMTLKATTMFPVQYVGSKTNAFEGYVDDVRISAIGEYADSIELDRLVAKARSVLDSNESLGTLIDEAQALLDQAAPAEDALADVAARLAAALEGADYELADYTAIDALIASVPSESVLHGMYTADSVKSLLAAIAAVERGLPSGMQSEVDGYAGGIVAAIDGLVALSGDDLVVRDVVPTACSEELVGETKPNGPAAAAVDGNPDTFWHTKWQVPADNCAGNQHWFNLELDKAYTVDMLKYTPRQNAQNGRLKNYEVLVSTDGGTTYESVAAGSLKNNTETASIAFDAVSGVTDVKLVFKNTFGDTPDEHATAGEISVRYVDDTVDLEGLNALIAQAKGLDEDAYTAESWKALASALKAAEDIAGLEAPTYEQVNAAKADLASALFALVPRVGDPGPDPDPDPETYVTVTFYSRVPGAGLEEVPVKKGDLVAKPVDPVIAGYEFLGWFVNEGGKLGAKWDFSTPVTADLYLVADWKKIDDAKPPVDPESPTDPSAPGGELGDTDGPGNTGGADRPGISLPGTGDDSMLPVIAAGVAGAAAVIAGIVVVLRRRNR